MIIFDLACSAEHFFEGWFRSADDYAKQNESGLVTCPHCGSREVRRLPSAVHVGSLVSPGPEPAAGIDPVALAKAFVEHLVRNSEDVGHEFAAEVRRIHYHDAPERAIRGVATAEECSALQEEGIEVLQLPKIKPEKLN